MKKNIINISLSKNIKMNNEEMYGYYLLQQNSKETKFNEFIKRKIHDGMNCSYLTFKDLKESDLQTNDHTTRYYTDIDINMGYIKGTKRIRFIFNNLNKEWLFDG